jgi:hypothetical protein
MGDGVFIALASAGSAVLGVGLKSWFDWLNERTKARAPATIAASQAAFATALSTQAEAFIAALQADRSHLEEKVAGLEAKIEEQAGVIEGLKRAHEDWSANPRGRASDRPNRILWRQSHHAHADPRKAADATPSQGEKGSDMNDIHIEKILPVMALGILGILAVLLVFFTVPRENQQIVTFIAGAISGAITVAGGQRLASRLNQTVTTPDGDTTVETKTAP